MGLPRGRRIWFISPRTSSSWAATWATCASGQVALPFRCPGRSPPARLAALWGLLEIINPNLPNLLVGILGFKAYFFYVPPRRDPGRVRLRCRSRSIPPPLPPDRHPGRPAGHLPVLQPAQRLLPQHVCLGRRHAAYIATFGSSAYVRVTGTFSFITGFTSYLQAAIVLSLAILGVVRWRLRGNLLALSGRGESGPAGHDDVRLPRPGADAVPACFPLYWWLAVAREGGSGATSAGSSSAPACWPGVVPRLRGSRRPRCVHGRAIGDGKALVERVASPLLSPLVLIRRSGWWGWDRRDASDRHGGDPRHPTLQLAERVGDRGGARTHRR